MIAIVRASEIGLLCQKRHQTGRRSGEDVFIKTEKDEGNKAEGRLRTPHRLKDDGERWAEETGGR